MAVCADIAHTTNQGRAHSNIITKAVELGEPLARASSKLEKR